MTVISADLICCLDAGRVAGLGTHQQLMESCLPYRKLYENQLQDFGTEQPAPEVTEGLPEIAVGVISEP
jgi:ABC-type transport system involved in cytochrome bd biosynthesis fused ATPase/permease subunit